jgi:hypothetical protein
VILGIGYVLIAILAGGIVTGYPLALLGVILVILALQRGYTTLRQAEAYWLLIGIAALGVLVDLGVALVLGVGADAVLRRRRG